VSNLINWSDVMDETRFAEDVGEDEPVPRSAIVETLTEAHGYDEAEALDLFRDESGFERVEGDLSNPLVIYNEYDDEKERTNGDAAEVDTESPGAKLDGEYPEPWVSEKRWFCWSYDEGRKIPRAPWHDDVEQDENATWDAWKSWKDEGVWTTFDEAAKWASKLSDYEMATAIPEFEDNDEPRSILVDFDNVRDPETGEMHEGVEDFVTEHSLGDAPMYASTSGTGVHLYIRGALPEGKKPSAEVALDDEPFLEVDDDSSADDEKLPSVEMYASSRFVAVSGELLKGEAEIPRDDDAVESMFQRHADDKTPTQDREPDLTREEVTDVDKTRDMEDILDAIQHVTPRDISLRSSVEKRSSGIYDIDPSWENSKSGTRVGYDDGWIHRKENTNMDALQVVALEERIISSPAEYPEGEDFFDALDELRSRGANIPEYDDKEVADVGEGLSDGAKATDGGEDEDSDDEDAGVHPAVSGLRGWLRGFEDAKDRRARKGEKTAKAESLLLEHERFKYVREDETLWRWDEHDHLWKDDGEEHVTALLKNGLDSEWSSQVNRDLLDRLKADPRVAISRDEFRLSPRMIPVENGILDVHTRELRERQPRDFAKFTLNVRYDEDAEAELWEQFIEAQTRNASDRKKLQEYAGYILLHGEMPNHKAMFLAGPQASGKSTFIDVVRKVLPSDVTGASTPQQMTRRFGAARLHGRWLNTSPDIPAEEIDDLGVFKMITGDDEIEAEIKMQQEELEFRPTAKHIFSANQLPSIFDADDAFWRRVLITTFPDTIDKEDRVDKYDEVLFEADSSAILNWMLDGLDRLLREGGFTADRSNDKTRERWQKWGTSVIQWKARRTRDDMDGSVVKSEAYEDYRRFCRDRGFRPVTMARFGGTLKDFPYIGDTTTKRDNKKRNAYSGIRFAPGVDDVDGSEINQTEGDSDDDDDSWTDDGKRWQG